MRQHFRIHNGGELFLVILLVRNYGILSLLILGKLPPEKINPENFSRGKLPSRKTLFPKKVKLL